MNSEKYDRLRTLKDPAIASNIAAYRKQGVSTGGHYTLAELLMEQRRRKPSVFPHIQVAHFIVNEAKQAEDGRVTYLEIWRAFAPGKDWQGNASVKVLGAGLGRVVEYCVRNRLPILSVLVVPTSTRKLTEKAIQNIFNECRELGVDTGSDALAFIEREERKSLNFAVGDLPQDDDSLLAGP